MELRLVGLVELTALVKESTIGGERNPETIAAFVFERLAAPAGALSGIADNVSPFQFYNHPAIHTYDPF